MLRSTLLAIAILRLAAVLWASAAPPTPATSERTALRNGSASAAERSAQPCRDIKDPGGFRLGPVNAAVRVDAVLEPTSPTALVAWLELRRLAVEHGELAVHIHLTPANNNLSAGRIRTWLLALGREHALVSGLRLLAQDGATRVHARLATAQTRAALARELGLDPQRHQDALNDPCLSTWAQERRRPAADALGGAGPGARSQPVFALDGNAFEGTATLERLRPRLAARRRRIRRRQNTTRAAPPSPRAVARRMRRPPLRGLVLGGLGLRHHFVLIVRDEDDTTLRMSLPPIIEFRRAQPGRLSLQLVAYGGSLGASELRHRLCAARILGRELQYIRYLATEPATRRRTAQRDLALLSALDKVPEKSCADEPDPSDLGMSTGGWLGGIPRSQGELGNLAGVIMLLDAAERPLSPLLEPVPAT